MPRRRKKRNLDVALGWNMKVGRGREAIRGLRRLIREHNPEALLLQEAMNYVALLRVLFPRWRVFAGTPGTQAANCAVMVRRNVPHGRSRRHGGRGRIRNRTPWYFRGKGRHVKKEGRVWRWVRVDGVLLLSGHRATEALGYNKAAGREEADNLIEWADSHDGPILAHLDWNNQHDDRRANGPRDIAEHAGGELLVPEGGEHRPDYALVRDSVWTAERVGREGSDHHCIKYTRVS